MAVQEPANLVVQTTLEEDADVLAHQRRRLPTEDGWTSVAGGEDFARLAQRQDGDVANDRGYLRRGWRSCNFFR